MILKTKAMGEIEVKDEDVFTFAQGLPGFEEERRFALIGMGPELPFSYLQSVDNQDVALIVTNPFLFYPDYEFELSDNAKNELGIEQEQDVAVWSVVTITGEVKDATLNLLAPVILNTRLHKGKQVILHGSMYETKHRLFVRQTDKAAVKKG